MGYDWPSYLSCEHGDLSLLFYFSEALLGREHSWKVEKKHCSTTFSSEESP